MFENHLKCLIFNFRYSKDLWPDTCRLQKRISICELTLNLQVIKLILVTFWLVLQLVEDTYRSKVVESCVKPGTNAGLYSTGLHDNFPTSMTKVESWKITEQKFHLRYNNIFAYILDLLSNILQFSGNWRCLCGSLRQTELREKSISVLCQNCSTCFHINGANARINENLDRCYLYWCWRSCLKYNLFNFQIFVGFSLGFSTL